jgi:copper chaperone CopZ
MATKLTLASPGVVHSSAHRTRLKAAGLHRHAEAKRVKAHLEKVPGVRDVRITHGGSIVIEHEERKDVIDNISEAIAQTAPDLLEILIGGPEIGVMKIGSVFTKWFSESQADDAKPSAPVELTQIMPVAFLSAGAYLVLIEGEALLAGVGPLALFYWAFDSHWKFKQEKRTQHVEEDVESVSKPKRAK